MAKCRLLYQENEELGKVVNSGRIAKLEGELALQKNFGEEVKKSQLGKTLVNILLYIFIYINVFKNIFIVVYNLVIIYFTRIR
jgi:hypothetical protein